METSSYCGYTENPYPKSPNPPMGVTFKGKAKSFLDAHEKLRLMLTNGKGKVFSTNGKNWKILDVKSLPTILDAIVEVESKGNVNLKIYCKNKKKSATIELRKLPDFEYDAVEAMQKTMKDFLDSNDDESNEIKKSLVTSKPKLFQCDICNWESKFSSELRNHMKTLHPENKSYKCQFCEKTFLSKKEYEAHMNIHKCVHCQLCFKTETEIENHIRCFHKGDKKRFNTSPSNSPPMKRLNQHIELMDVDHDVSEDLMDIEIEASAVVTRLKELQIKKLESRIVELEKQLKNKEDKKNQALSRNIFNVHKMHLPLLRGFERGYKIKGDGACFVNAASVHLYNNEKESKNLKKVINQHLIENSDFYCDQIVFPFEEQIGVGNKAKIVTINNKDEMMTFLKSEDALLVFGNFHDMTALANIFNINISVFSYRNTEEGNWIEISPNYSVVSKDVKKLGRCIKDMYLYHSVENHFDLLVKDPVETFSQQKEKENVVSFVNEKMLMEVEPSDIAKDLCEEIVLLKDKQNGKKSNHVVLSKDYKCCDCEQVFKSEAILKIHMTENHKPEVSFECESCKQIFKSEGIMNAHVKENHSSLKLYSCKFCNLELQTQNDLILHEVSHKSEWNCEDCSFQANDVNELMKHLKETGHQPCKEIDKRNLFKDYRQCYTCRSEFDGYITLMDHRKEAHPSNKKCRNYPNSCRFGVKCWYLHEDTDSNREVNNVIEGSFKCIECDEEIIERRDFMVHKKSKHPQSVLMCEKFKRGECTRNDSSCWFKHDVNAGERSTNNLPIQVFHKSHNVTVPPDHIAEILQTVTQICKKMEVLEGDIQILQKEKLRQ